MVRPNLLKPAVIALACCLAAATASPAQTYTTLINFSGSNGQTPQGGLVQDSEGNLYGTTLLGGASSSCSTSSTCGVIFEITSGGTLEILHSFDGTDGSAPNGVILGTDGKLYGTTNGGGANNAGTFFSILPGGSLNTLYNFCSQTDCTDGIGPLGGLIQGSDGNFYGTTSGNAEPDECPFHCGTVFKITSAGVLTTLYSFPTTNGGPQTIGYGPMSGVVQGNDGNFYGTTAYGGNWQCGVDQPLYCGTIFKLTPAGALTTLYDFCAESGCPDGFDPGGLVQGTDGNFYGPTEGGGAPGVCPSQESPFETCGTIFKITPLGTLTTLHSFDLTDGEGASQLVQADDGNFYGTTISGGANGTGTIFRMTPAGSLITLYSFGTAPDGVIPSSALLLASGSFYGETALGGSGGDGTVFSFAIGMGGTSPSSNELSLFPSAIQVGSSGPVVMTATVAPTTGSGTPTGVVAFFNGSSEVGSSDLSAGTATFDYNPSALAINTYQITAIYSGDGTFAGSTSSPQTLTVNSLPPAATPSISPAGGIYSSAQTVTISDSTSGATIYYTNDGTTPTTGSAVYSAPLTVSSTETIEAIAWASGYNISAVATAAYTIGPNYQVSVTPSSLTIVAGQSGTATFTVTPTNGFNSQVSFSCSGLPSGASCSFNPSSVTPSGGNPATSTLTISTTAASAAVRMPASSSPVRPIYAFLLVPWMGFIFIAASGRRRSSLRTFSVLAVLAATALLLSCGSSSSTGGGTPPGTSTVTVTASTSGSGAISQSATLNITVTQ